MGGGNELDVNVNAIPDAHVTNDGVNAGGLKETTLVGSPSTVQQTELLARLVAAVEDIKHTVDNAMLMLKVNESRLNTIDEKCNGILTRIADVEAIKHTVDNTVLMLTVNECRLDTVDDKCNRILTRLETIENTLSPQCMSKNVGAEHTPKTTIPPKIKENTDGTKYKNQQKQVIDEVAKKIVFDISSDDDYHVKSRKRVSSQKKQTTRICDIRPVYSNYHRRSTSRMEEKISLVGDTSPIGRRLSFSASPTISHPKQPKTEPMDMSFHDNVGQIMSKFVKPCFVPSPEMQLSTLENHVSTYIFHPHADIEETLFKVDNFTSSRKVFHSLIPGNTIHNQVIHMLALKDTWFQNMTVPQNIWSLPPSFVRDVNRGHTIEDLILDYSDFWMWPFRNLKHVFVPIEDVCGNWYLMVASIREGFLYHMDPFFEKQNIWPRQETIKNLWEVILQMLRSDHYRREFSNLVLQVNNWEMCEPIGNFEGGFCQHSAVWVMCWLLNSSDFKPGPYEPLKEEVVRMRVTMDLLLGYHNEFKDKLQKKSEDAWRTGQYA